MRDPGLRVERADWQRHGDRLAALRYSVFVDEQGVAAQLESDDADADCLHVLVSDAEGALAGTARIDRGGRIGRMAVRSDRRRRGAGSLLLRELLLIAAENGLGSVFMHAQSNAARFYELRGFRYAGPSFVEAGLWHRKMILALDGRFDSSCAATQYNQALFERMQRNLTAFEHRSASSAGKRAAAVALARGRGQ